MFSDEDYIIDRRILVMWNRYEYKRIENGATEGVQMLKDVRSITEKFGIGRSFVLDWRFYDFEIFTSFWV